MTTAVPQKSGMNAQATTCIGELLFHLTPINEAVVVCQGDVHDGARQYLLANLGAALANIIFSHEAWDGASFTVAQVSLW